MKTSILTEAQFQSLHGDCWRLYNPASGNVDISGTDLNALIGSSSLSSAAGRVLRAKGGFANSTLGGTQEDAFKSHVHNITHGHSVVNNSHTFIYGNSSENWSIVNTSNNSGSDYNGKLPISVNNFTGNSQSTGNVDETRMANITVNMFIKVNKECNAL